jgi:tRNA dimethylallyltransferase
VGQWLRDAERILRQAEAAGALPIVVGGTGLYFKALLEGLAATPDIPGEVRRKWSSRLAADGLAALHTELISLDPVSAARIRPGDPQRILRALEVSDATGRRLSDWRRQRATLPLLAVDETVRFILDPERADLYARIDARFDSMVAEGALAEVESLLARDLDPNLPVMKAIGVREFASVLRGEVALDSAVSTAKMQTRRYAKRQMTWLRNQMLGWERIGS